MLGFLFTLCTKSRGCQHKKTSRKRKIDDLGFEDAKRLAIGSQVDIDHQPDEEEKLIEYVDDDGDLVARKLLALQNKEEIVAQPQAVAHVVASAATSPPPPPLDYFRLDMTASEWFCQLNNCAAIR